MSIDVLLIGGPADGQRMSITHAMEVIAVPDRPEPMCTFDADGARPRNDTARVLHYRQVPFYTEIGVFAGIYSFDGDPMSAIIRLMDGYRGTNQ